MFCDWEVLLKFSAPKGMGCSWNIPASGAGSTLLRKWNFLCEMETL